MFNELKALDIAYRFINLNNNSINYMKLLKYMYILEREFILKYSSRIISDSYVSMDFGPVLSNTYDLIKEIYGMKPKSDSSWHEYFSAGSSYKINITKHKECQSLSEIENQQIYEIFHEFKDNDQWEISDLTHNFPEWEDPSGSAISFSLKDILIKNVESEEIQNSIHDEIQYYQDFDELFC